MWVDLSQGDGNAAPLTYQPSRIHVSIRPQPPTAFDEDRVTHLVETRYHPQISTNTKLSYLDRHNVTHLLYVKGIQDVELRNRHLILMCEEVLTPPTS